MPATLDMPKKQQKKDAEPEVSEEIFLLKLPVKYRDALIAVKRKTGRPMTTSGQMALEAYFREVGVPFTPNWPES